MKVKGVRSPKSLLFRIRRRLGKAHYYCDYCGAKLDQDGMCPETNDYAERKRFNTSIRSRRVI